MTRPTRRSRHDPTADTGFSYVEMIVAVTILGIIMVPLFGAFTSIIASGSRAQANAELDLAMQSAADRVNRADLSCDYSSYAEAAAVTAGWLPSAASVTHLRYSPGSGGTVEWVAGACPISGLNTTLVQLVQVTLTDPRSGVARMIQVVKSDV
ncbi:MAG: type II secretion system protein [Ilumatobacteraceae bacterium]